MWRTLSRPIRRERPSRSACQLVEPEAQVQVGHPVVLEVPAHEGGRGDPEKELDRGFTHLVAPGQIIPLQPALGLEDRLERRARVDLGPAEVERDVGEALHELEVPLHAIERGLGIEDEDVEGAVDV
jgi:hypothetical protein